MKNYEAEKLKKIIAQKELAMVKQVEETDRLRNENLSLKAELTQCYRIGYNKAIDDAAENYRCVEILHKEHNLPFEGFEIVRAMREFGKEMWNMAIEEAANSSSADERNEILKLKR